MLGDLRVAGLRSFTVIAVPVKFSCRTVTATKPFSFRGLAVAVEERDVMREMKRERRNVSGEPF